MRIGIFDTGKGGEIIAEQYARALPSVSIVSIIDKKHSPYGNRTAEEITQLTASAIGPYIDQLDGVVIACNTATAHAIDALRETYPDIPILGFEPMLKPVAQSTHSKHICVLATPATLASQRYQRLRYTYGRTLTIDEPDTREWARHIDAGESDAISLEQVSASVNSGADTVLLACTHYLALRPALLSLVGAHASIVEPSDAVLAQLRRVLSL